MSILVLAPTLKTASGHDHAFCTELNRYAGASNITILASDKFQLEADLPAIPFFSVDPYEYRWLQREARQPVPLRKFLSSAVQDLRKIDFSIHSKLILHTADPIHLVALSRSLPRFKGDIYLGFMLPPSFWLRASIGRLTLSAASDLAIHLLKRRAAVTLYSETGAIRFDHRSIGCLLKLPPVQSVKIPEAQTNSAPIFDRNGRIKIGFFGAPLDDKGFQILLQLANDAEIRARFEIRLFLPPDQQELAAKINHRRDTIIANSEVRDIPTYFDCLSSVDLVYTLYSPLAYKDRMSGIVQDAILAGKPLLVTTGCTDMRRFIDRVAPGAYVHADYSAAPASECLASVLESLGELSEQARIGAETIRKMKTFEAFFSTSDA